MERERERERERSVSRHSSPHDARRSSVDERSRDSDTRRESDARRSRSRSPVVRNGPVSVSSERHKSDSALHNNIERSQSLDSNKDAAGVKEERRDIMIIDEKRGTAPPLPPKPDEPRNHVIKDPHNDLLVRTYQGFPPPTSMALSLERARLMTPYLGLERPPHPSLWNPLEKSAIDQHRLELQREMERERDRILHRFPNPLAPMIDHERIREQQEMLIRERALRDRETLERMAVFDRERAAMMADIERSKLIPPLRPVDPFLSGGPPPPVSLYAPRPGAGSPTVNHSSNHGSKTNSPSSSVGAPPPLIPSGSIRAHTASPSTKPLKVPASPISHSNHSDSAPPPPIIKDKTLDGTTNGIETNHSQSR